MDKVVLNAETREVTGKTKMKELRKQDIVPGIVYRAGKKTVNLKVNARELHRVLHTAAGENVLIALKVKSDKKQSDKTCIIKELQRDPIKDTIIHIDLKEISLTEKIKVKVPVHSHGEAEGVVKDGGVLDHPLWEVEVECLPTAIPQRITVEVESMKIGDTVYVKDLKVPDDVKILTDSELTVLSVTPPAKEEVVEEVPAEGEVEEPEVIGKGKKEEVEEEAAEEAEAPAKEEKKE